LHSLTDDKNDERLQLASKCAITLFSDGRYEEAKELQVQVMETSKRVLTNEHPSMLNSMHNLAFTLQSQTCYEEALALMERCFQLCEQVLGEEHPDTQLSLNVISSWQAECE
jgi:hypothetical protein